MVQFLDCFAFVRQPGPTADVWVLEPRTNYGDAEESANSEKPNRVVVRNATAKWTYNLLETRTVDARDCV